VNVQKLQLKIIFVIVFSNLSHWILDPIKYPPSQGCPKYICRGGYPALTPRFKPPKRYPFGPPLPILHKTETTEWILSQDGMLRILS